MIMNMSFIFNNATSFKSTSPVLSMPVNYCYWLLLLLLLATATNTSYYISIGSYDLR